MAFGDIIALGVMVCLVIGIIGIIKPTAFGLRSRWHAGLVLVGAIGFVGFGQMASPDPALADPAFIQRRGFITFAVWIVASALLLWKAKAVSSLHPNPIRQHTDGFPQLQPEQERGKGIGPLFERFYDQFRAGEITLDAYKAEVLEQQADTKEDLRLTRACRSDAVRAGTLHEHEAEVEQLQEDLEECAWRLRWIKDQAYKQSISREGFDERGKWARFEYADADGVVTKRNIAMWEKRGAYIVGYDRSRKEERTFRQDRISEWVSG